MNAELIIVGLGPTGATLAALLGMRGLRVVAFDKLPGLYPLPRAIGLDHEVMRIVQELGVADDVLRPTAPYRPSEYRGMSGQLIKRLDMAPPPFRLGLDQPASSRRCGPGFPGLRRSRCTWRPMSWPKARMRVAPGSTPAFVATSARRASPAAT